MATYEEKQASRKAANAERIKRINERQERLDAEQAERDDAEAVDIEALEAEGVASATFTADEVQVTEEDGSVKAVGFLTKVKGKLSIGDADDEPGDGDEQ